MLENDPDLIELNNLIGDAPPPVDDTLVSTGESLDMLMEELDNTELYAKRKELVNADLLKYIDNPKLPTPTERLNMLDEMGKSLWYDKWQQERCAQVEMIPDVDLELVRTRIFNPDLQASKETIAEAFQKVEMIERKKDEAWEKLHEYADQAKVEPEVISAKADQ